MKSSKKTKKAKSLGTVREREREREHNSKELSFTFEAQNVVVKAKKISIVIRNKIEKRIDCMAIKIAI